ncbi:hypothetical protein F4780DRAFT_56704 [Xylariomycetidae sp. FL0641]|nr:hypothetical protein F4780DRAFT_56704 [Xylariomycetidae sp. FL0641]
MTHGEEKATAEPTCSTDEGSGQGPDVSARGYPYLAKVWSMTQIGMVRKFSDLAILNILYLQAEIADLEEDLVKEQKKDRASTVDDERVECDWDWLSLSSHKKSKQWALFLKIRAKLVEYHAAISQYTQMASLRPPTELQRDNMSRIIGERVNNRFLGNFRACGMGGAEGPRLYQSRHVGDLILLDAEEEENDFLSRVLSRPILERFQDLFGKLKTPMALDLENPPTPDNLSRINVYGLPTYQRLNKTVGALFGAVPLIFSIVVLYLVRPMRIRVTLVCVFTLLFCLALSCASKARRIEVFAATAAFGSVQVVFVSQTGS